MTRKSAAALATPTIFSTKRPRRPMACPQVLLRYGFQSAPDLMRTTFRPATWCYLKRW